MPYRTPDLSKFTRATEDAVTKAGLWAGDARVAECARLAKVWTGHDLNALPVPGAIVACVEIDSPGAFRELAQLYIATHDEAWQRLRGAA